MIISHKHKFIFIAIPKTATHAIRFALRPYLAEDDMEQVGLFVKKKLPFEETSLIDHGHIKCKDIKEVLGDTVWNTYFKFAIVRNPYDRFISYSSFMNRENPNFKTNPAPYLYNSLLNKNTHKHILFQPQTEFICDNENKIMVDYVGKYEELQQAFDFICNKINVPTVILDKINTSQRGNYNSYYNNELIDLVSKHYKDDINVFNYQF